MRRFLSWPATILFAVFFGLILGTFDVLLRLATPFGQRAVEYVGLALQTTLVWSYRLAGIRPDLERSKGIEPRTSYIVVSNHQSMFDIPLFAWAMPTNFPKYISKRSLGSWIPAVSYNLRRGGHALIDREDREGSVAAISRLARAVVANRSSAVIFPEGTRARDGTISPFKTAGTLALLAEAPDVPVVPVCIDNSWQIMRHGMKPIPFGIHLRMWIGDPIERRPGEDPRALLVEVERRIHETLARFRGDRSA